MCYGTILSKENSIVVGKKALLVYSFIVIACLCHTLLISKVLCFDKRVLQSSNVILSTLLHFKQSDIRALLVKYGYGIPSLSPLLTCPETRPICKWNSYIGKIVETGNLIYYT